MNRRSFLGAITGVLALPFVKRAEAQENAPDSIWESPYEVVVTDGPAPTDAPTVMSWVMSWESPSDVVLRVTSAAGEVIYEGEITDPVCLPVLSSGTTYRHKVTVREWSDVPEAA